MNGDEWTAGSAKASLNEMKDDPLLLLSRTRTHNNLIGHTGLCLYVLYSFPHTKACCSITMPKFPPILAKRLKSVPCRLWNLKLENRKSKRS
jgi:hypothetical protein